MNKKHFLSLVSSLAVCYLVSVIGSALTMASITSGWYEGLNKPFFVPPDWIFAPVWFLLYTLMGVALFLVLKEGGKKTKINSTIQSAVILFSFQLFLNVLWSYTFFYKRNILAALFVISLLLFIIVVTAKIFFKVKKQAGYLFVPYILWVAFALVLNFSLWQMNLRTLFR